MGHQHKKEERQRQDKVSQLASLFPPPLSVSMKFLPEEAATHMDEIFPQERKK